MEFFLEMEKKTEVLKITKFFEIAVVESQSNTTRMLVEAKVRCSGYLLPSVGNPSYSHQCGLSGIDDGEGQLSRGGKDPAPI